MTGEEKKIPVTFDANENLWTKFTKFCDENAIKYGPKLNLILKDFLKSEGLIKNEN